MQGKCRTPREIPCSQKQVPSKRTHYLKYSKSETGTLLYRTLDRSERVTSVSMNNNKNNNNNKIILNCICM